MTAQLLYQSGQATVWWGDAADVLPTIATESVDLVVTDPPYGMRWRSNQRAELFDELAGDGAEDREGLRCAIAECVRVVGQHRHLYVFGPDDLVDGLKVGKPAQLVWAKGKKSAGDLASPWGRAHEPITFCVSEHRHAGKAGSDSLTARLRRDSVITGYGPPTGRTLRHPTEKPWQLLRELVESSSTPGDLVLDPFAGVGSTGVAAVLSGRRTILVELDQGFARLAVERVQAAERLAGEADGL